MLQKLTTPRGENLTATPWDIYPRPQLRRSRWLNLNGTWDFAAGETCPETFDRTIRVPFCPESQLSGVEEHFPEGMPLWYRRKVSFPEDFRQGRVLLHIGAADQVADVYINGEKAAHHEGGYESFTVDITPYLREENEIRIRCVDDLTDQSFPYGKQVRSRGGMWYTPVSGLWQTVWAECVPETYIRRLNMEMAGTSVTITTEPPLDGTLTVAGLGSWPVVKGSVTVAPENPRLWSPEDPYLYGFTLEAGEDRVESYFALRTLEIQKVGRYQRLCLNGQPYFFHGLLDQGYWPEGLLTPPAPESYADDILAMKKLGFNTLRKHIKVEMEEFYYQCDRLGMVVFQDMVNNGPYSFLRDTVLPTFSLAAQAKVDDRNFHKDEAVRRRFREGMTATVKQLKNHPSIFYWTIFNEAWGQFDSDRVCEEFRTLDSSRWIDSTSGWFRRSNTDVDSRHVYFRKVALKAEDKPLVLSEFGGKTWKVEGHVFNPDKSYGYGGCPDQQKLNEALVKLYREQVVPNTRKGLCAAIYTQVSDVEDEINGLLTYDRRVEKILPEYLLPVAMELQAAVKEG